jgi:serine/threonine protein kinase/tetratricopeptide (TPR) repeat protein
MQHDPDAPTQAAPPAPPGDPARSDTFAPGAVEGRYTILERVGKGGMGEVYAAYDAKLDRRVALKLLLSERPENESRLSREAQAMARLSHPNVVAVFDTGVIAGRLFIAMEFVQGTTLRGWQRAARRSVAEILRVYAEAGRGLAAAHAAGLVHRDFKPDNVLVSPQGAVKVTDFGLVRADSDDRTEAMEPNAAPAGPVSGATRADTVTGREPEADPASRSPSPSGESAVSGSGSWIASGRVPTARTSGPLETPMTEDGAVMGTVGFMAPEQYVSEPVSAKTDQFSFCVALYDALYGQKPFAGKGMAEIAAAALGGRVEPPPKGHNVPARIHRVLLRGLSATKEARYRSMDELLDDLVRDRRAERLRLAGVVAGVVAVGLAVILTQRAATARQGSLCAGAGPLAREVWNDDVKKAVEASVRGTGLAFADDTWARTREQLDGYMGRWATMHEQTCRATRIDGHQAEPLMAVRMACLEQRRAAVRALTRVLEHADRQAVEKAVEASRNLPSIEDCADVTSLMAVKALPADPAQRAAVLALEEEVGDLRVRGDSGKYKDVVASAPAVVERARASGYEPVLADALLVLGEAQDRVGTKPDAATSFREAFLAAEAGRSEDVKVRALIALEVTLADQRKFDDARMTSRHAAAASARVPDPETYRADLHSANAWLSCRDGKYDESTAEFRQAIAVAERNADAKPVRLARMYARAGGVLGDAGRFTEAMDLLDRADATFVRVLGPDHPARVIAMVNRSATQVSAGHVEDAVATADKALELARRVLSPDSGTIANLESNRADALHAMGRYEDARASAERAVGIGRTVFGAKSVTTAGYLINLGEALEGLGRHEEAVRTFNEVLEVIEPALPPTHEWLAEARAGRAEANLELGHAKEGLVDLEKALTTYRGIEHKTFLAQGVQARVEAALARTLVLTGGKTDRVAELVSSALATFRAQHDDARTQALVEWAAKHRVTPT